MRRRTDGVNQLPDDECALRALLRCVQDVRPAATLPTALSRVRRVALDVGVEPDLAAPFPLRPRGMGVAVVDALGAAAAAFERERGSRAAAGANRWIRRHTCKE